jgi:hypothetical protein
MKTVCHGCGSPLEGGRFIGAQDDVDDNGKPQFHLLVNCPGCSTTLSIATVTVRPRRVTLADVRAQEG